MRHNAQNLGCHQSSLPAQVVFFAVGLFWQLTSGAVISPAQAACTPSGPYTNSADTVLCDPGIGESLATLNGNDNITVNSGSVNVIDTGAGNDTVTVNGGAVNVIDTGAGGDSVTINDGSVGVIEMGTGNDVFILNGGVVSTVNQDGPASTTQGSDTAIISGGSIAGTLSQGGGSDSYTHSGGGFVNIVDQGGGNDTATIGPGAQIGVIQQGSGSDTLTITGGIITTVDQGSFSDALFMSGGTVGSIDQGTGNDAMEISGGAVSGAVTQGAGVDVFVMSGGSIGSLNQGGDLDFAYISGGTISGLFYAGDYVEFSGGTIGEINLEAGDNTLYMWGTAAVLGPVNSESGQDSYFLYGGSIGSNVTTGSADDVVTIGGIPSAFNGVPIVGAFDATTINGSVVMEGGNDTLTMNGGTITGDIFMDAGLGNANALSSDGFDDLVVLNAGTVGGSIFTDSATSGQTGNDTVVIAGATVGGSVVTEDGDDVVQLSGGSVGGSIDTGAGADQIALLGGLVVGDVNAGDDDDVVVLDGADVSGGIRGGSGSDSIELSSGSVGFVEGNDGDDLIVWANAAATVGAGGLNNGAILGGSGSDIVVINDPTIDLSAMTLDGGDDVSAADGFVDVLALLNGWSGALNGSRTRNFEVLYIDGGTVVFDDAAITVSSDSGIDSALSAAAGFPVPYGILVDNGGILDATNSLTVNGNVTLRDSTLLVGNAGTSSARISGQLENPFGSIVDLWSGGPATGDVLHISGNYIGGGELRLDAALDASSAADTLIIEGIVLSGTTLIHVRDVGDGTGVGTGLGPGLGIRLVDVSASGGTAAGQFMLAGGPITVNAFNYDLYLQSDGVWYLQSALQPIVPAIASVPHVIEDIGLTFIGTLHERVGEQEHLKGSAGKKGVWARFIGQRAEQTFDTSALGQISTATQLVGFQGGFDVQRWRWSDGAFTHAGLSFGYADARSRSQSNGIGGTTDFTGGLVGAHLTHYGHGGWYADAGLYGAMIDVDASAGEDSIAGKSNAWMATLEIGQALSLGWAGLILEPQVQLIYVDRHLSSFTNTNTAWQFSLDDSLIGRFGLRLKSSTDVAGNGPGRATGYIKANLWDVLAGGRDSLTIGTLPVTLQGRSIWADAGLGFSIEALENVSIFADGDVQFDIGGSDYHAITGKVGARLNW